ncbi:MAG: flotillin family protein [Proteobacteria bacterium]|nr:flotillin family protein [Pseudomonadota bacterium]
MEINFGSVLLTIIVVVVAIGIAWWLLSKLYQRSTSETSFVRTGFLGLRVCISGGALVIPVLHEVTRVNMNTMRIGVSHRDHDALITQDRLRVNVDADFYVRVAPTTEAVNAAARTLGGRTMSIDAMRQLLSARFDDALRTAAAESTMEALHEHRSAFAQRVRALASQGIDTSGLEIDSVSISSLDQASREFFNPNNAFDAAGLTKLTEEIEQRRKRRNEVEREAQVQIQRQNLAAERQMLELQKEEEYARLMQERDIAIRRAQEQAQISIESAEMQRSSQVAEVTSTEAVERAKLVSERTVREEKLRVEQQVREIEISKALTVEVAETKRRRALELEQQRNEIEIAEHSRLRNEALVDAERSRAEAVKAEESVVTLRELERAQRDKALVLVAAQRDVEVKGLAIVQAAEAEREAAARRAEAMRTTALAESDAERMRQATADQGHEIEARARRALNEAENAMSAETLQLRIRLATLERIEAVVRESARPLEKISEIKIVHVDGLSAPSPTGGGGEPAASVSDQVMSSALKYKLQAPLVEALLESAGINAGDARRDLLP